MGTCQYNLSIYEYIDTNNYSKTLLTNINTGVIYSDGRYLRTIRSGRSIVLHHFDKLGQWFRLVEDGIWVSKRDIGKIVFFDIFKNGVQKPDEELAFAEQLIQYEDYIIGWKVDRDYNSTYYTKHIPTGKLCKTSENYDEFYYDDKLLFGYRVTENDLTCLNIKCEKQWRIPLTSLGTGFAAQTKVSFTNELVIVNMGTNQNSNNYEVAAFSKKNGIKVWSKTFENRPYQSLTKDGKVYITLGKRMIVLNANTGDILVNEPMNFVDEEIDPTHGYSISLFPSGQSLFAYSQTHAAIRIFSTDGKTLQQEIILPPPKSEHNFGRISPLSATIPSECDGKIYIQLNHFTGLGAIGVLEPTEGTPIVNVKDRLPFVLEKIPAKKGHSYKLSIEHNNFHNLVTASRYELIEVGQYYGKHRSEHDHFDPKLNDQILLSVTNNSTFPSDAKMQLEEMAKDVEEFLDTFLTKSPLTGKPFKINVELI